MGQGFLAESLEGLIPRPPPPGINSMRCWSERQCVCAGRESVSASVCVRVTMFLAYSSAVVGSPEERSGVTMKNATRPVGETGVTSRHLDRSHELTHMHTSVGAHSCLMRPLLHQNINNTTFWVPV